MSGRAEPEPRQQKDGTWKVNFMVKGVRRSAYGPAGPTGKNVCRAKMREMVKRLEAGQGPRDSRIKVSAWVETWRDVKLPAGKRKASTREAYLTAVRLHVLPTLGEKRLADVTESDCEAVLLAMKRAGLSNNYRRVVHTAMLSLFTSAARERKITVSPMLYVERPPRGKSKAVAMTPPQVADLIGSLRRTSLLVQLVPFLALTGTRRGEALGVRWEDVDEAAGVIHLRWQVIRTQEKGLHLAPHKTDEDGDEDEGRDIELTPAVREVLAQRRRVQARHRLKAPVGTWEDTGLIFTTMRGGLVEPNNVNRAFRQAASRAGLPTIGKSKVTPHSLRHSVASLLLAAGVDEKVVAEILGHSSPRITREVYQHVTRTQQTAALAKVGEALGL